MAFSTWSRLQGLLFGGAIGAAFSRAVEPIIEPIRQHAWQRNTVRVLDVGTLAELIARGLVTETQVADEASRTGYDENRLRARTALAQSYPGLGELDAMSNRKVLSPALVDKALSRHGIPAEYHAAVKALFSDLLNPEQLAAAIHRGLVPSAGLLLGEQPEPPFKVDAYPVQDIPPIKEAAGAGYDEKRLQVLVGLQGLPMGPHEAAQAYFRGIITHGDYIRAFNTSNMRNEWAKAILDQTRQIPTARDFFENALRGYHELDWALAQAERHGMSAEDALVIYQNQGRPMNVRQITQALARGGVFKPEPGEKQDPYDASIIEGNIKPAYYDLAKALRYSYPSPMYFRALQTSGVLSPEQAEQRYLEIGWEPTLARQVAQAFGQQRATAEKEATVSDLLTLYDGTRASEAETLTAIEDLGYPPDEARRKIDLVSARRVASAKGTAISDLHTQFKKQEIDAATTLQALADLGLPEWARTQIVTEWGIALAAAGPTRTVSVIKADFQAGRITRDEAVRELETLGLTAPAANLFLDT